MIRKHLSLQSVAARFASAAFLTCAGALSVTSALALEPTTTVTYTVLHSFAPATEGENPTTGLKKFSDGNLYGCTTQASTDAGSHPVLFRIAPDGTGFTVLHNFSGDEQGSAPSGFLQTNSGLILGTCRAGGANNKGLFYSMNLDGTGYTVLYDCVDDEVNATQPIVPVQASDGNFYGAANDGGSIGNGVIYKLVITPTVSIQTLLDLTGDNGRGAVDQPVIGGDGNVYVSLPEGGKNADDPGNAEGLIYRITPSSGDVTAIHTFLSSEAVGGSLPLTLGPDGFIYGVSPQGGEKSFGQPAEGSIVKVALGGTTRVLHLFDEDVDDYLPFAQLTVGSDGALYGGAEGLASTSFPGENQEKNGEFYRISPMGAFETLYRYPAGTALGRNPLGPMVETTPGTFVGVTAGGGDSDGGVIFKLTVSGSLLERHPFFANEASLGGENFYLSFADGTPFGYFAFLDDMHYMFSYDLGYEYVFENTDSSSGVYFYDFASSTYFYTSPTEFPYLYDFTLNTFLYYFQDTTVTPGSPHVYTSAPRTFYDFGTNAIITK